MDPMRRIRLTLLPVLASAALSAPAYADEPFLPARPDPVAQPQGEPEPCAEGDERPGCRKAPSTSHGGFGAYFGSSGG